jgi:uncharacterized protein
MRYLSAIILLLLVAVAATPAADLNVLMAKANTGDAEAQYQLGKMYSSGEGVERDPDRAFAWFQKAAHQGNTQAMYALAVSYYNGDVLGGSVVSNREKAWIYFTLATLKGDTQAAEEANRVAGELGTPRLDHAQCQLAVVLLKGEEAPPDVARGVQMLENLARSGSFEARLELANAYEKGVGVPINGDKAVYWLHQALLAKPDDRTRMRLVNMYLDDMLVPKDPNAAQGECAALMSKFEKPMCMAMVAQRRDPLDERKVAEWYKRAAETGSYPGMIQYGRVLADGKGVKQDYAKAYYWLSVAHAGSKFAETNQLLREVMPKLSQEEIAKQNKEVAKTIARLNIKPVDSSPDLKQKP